MPAVDTSLAPAPCAMTISYTSTRAALLPMHEEVVVDTNANAIAVGTAAAARSHGHSYSRSKRRRSTLDDSDIDDDLLDEGMEVDC